MLDNVFSSEAFDKQPAINIEVIANKITKAMKSFLIFMASSFKHDKITYTNYFTDFFYEIGLTKHQKNFASIGI